MKNYERILEAKTREDVRNAIFGYGDYLLRPNSNLRIDEWLDDEEKTEEQMIEEILEEMEQAIINAKRGDKR